MALVRVLCSAGGYSVLSTVGSLPGEFPRLGLDRSEGRGFVALISVLFRDSFEDNTHFSGGRKGCGITWD